MYGLSEQEIESWGVRRGGAWGGGAWAGAVLRGVAPHAAAAHAPLRHSALALLAKLLPAVADTTPGMHPPPYSTTHTTHLYPIS